MNTALELSTLKPDFMSVTYGAGGQPVPTLQKLLPSFKKGNTPALAHLTCVGSCKSDLDGIVENLKKAAFKIYWLRGDFPQDERSQSVSCECKHASDLARFKKKRAASA